MRTGSCTGPQGKEIQPVGEQRENGNWIRRFHPSEEARVRLVCFPHAGGSAPFYFPMSQKLSPGVDVLSLQYPGRQDRRQDRRIDTIAEYADVIAEELKPWLDLPTAFFGHSMGAVLAFEVTRRLERTRDTLRSVYSRPAAGPRRVTATKMCTSGTTTAWKVLEAADEVRGGEFRCARGLDGVQPGKQLGEERVGLHLGEGGAQAVVHTESEGQMPVGSAGHSEKERILEEVLVPVGRRIGQEQGVALADGDASQFVVLDGRTQEALDRCDPADHLVDRGRQQTEIVLQTRQLSGILHERLESARDGGAGRVGPAVAMRM